MYAAKIDYLFNTDRKIVTWGDANGFERPSSFAELKKDKGVLVGDIAIPNTKIREVMIGDDCYLIEPNSHNHTGGKMLFLEVLDKLS
jgi:hypothetical protein